MDAETQKLIERTRQRRELLNKKLSESDLSTRKRRPLCEDTSINVVQQQDDDDSPKRQCLRLKEQQIKEDTPAIKGLASRMNDLAQQHFAGNEDKDTVQVPIPKPRKRSSPPKVNLSQSVPSSRKTRLAQLAQTINNWEDDYSHPSVRKNEQKHQAPLRPGGSVLTSAGTKTQNQTPRARDTDASIMKRQAPPPPAIAPQLPVKPQTPKSGDTEAIPVNAKGLNESPPSGDQTDEEPTAKSVHERLATWAQKVDTAVASSPKDSSQPLASRAPRLENPLQGDTPLSSKVQRPQCGEPRVRPLSCFEPTSENRQESVPRPLSFTEQNSSDCFPAAISTPVASVKSARGRPSFDPTQLPVSARMASWQKKVAAAEVPKVEEPTECSVSARMSAWEKVTANDQATTTKMADPSALKFPVKSNTPKTRSGAAPLVSASGGMARVTSGPRSPAKTPSSPLKSLSPVKQSSALKNVQHRLFEQTTTTSSMVDKMKQERMAELQAIQSRWQDGILRDDASEGSLQCTDLSGTSSSTNSPPVRAADQREVIKAKLRSDFQQKLAAVGLERPNDSVARSSCSSKSSDLRSGSNPQETKKSYVEPAPKAFKSEPAPPPPPPPPPPPLLPAQGSLEKMARHPTPVVNSAPQRAQNVTSIYRLIATKPALVQKSPVPARPPKRVQFEDSFDSIDESENDFLKDVDTLGDHSDAELHETSQSESTSDESSDTCGTGLQRNPGIDDDSDDVSISAFVPASVRQQCNIAVPPKADSSQSDDEERPRGFFRQPGREIYAKSTTNLLRLAQESHSGSGSSTVSHSSRDTYSSCNQMTSEGTDSEDGEAEGSVDDLLDEAFDSESEENKSPRKPVQLRQNQVNDVPSTDDDTDEEVVLRRRSPLVYSVSMYRSKRYSSSTPSAKVKIVRNSQYTGQNVQVENVKMPTELPPEMQKKSLVDKVRGLHELVIHEQNVILQTSNALNQCCSEGSYFVGSAEEVECNRLLLVSCQKRQAYLTEIQRLKETGKLDGVGHGTRGSLTLSDIRLPLKKDFVTKIGTVHDTKVHHFIILVRNGPHVICTQMMSTHDPMVRGSLDFPNLIKINDISSDFKITLEIYCMTINKVIKEKKGKKKVKNTHPPVESPAGPLSIRSSSFNIISAILLTLKNLDKTCFALEGKLIGTSALHGTIYLRLKCVMEANVEEKGFLTMFEDVSGLGAWHRRWCVLNGHKVSYWKYPDDEKRKEPMGYINLKRCITEKLQLTPRDVCARPNTFEMVTIRPVRPGEKETLTTKKYNTMATIKYMLSADTKEERIVWCNKLNRALANIRTWHADALRPVQLPSHKQQS